MSNKAGWRESLRDPNTIGWIAFLILVVSFGVGMVVFDNGGSSKSGMERTVQSVPNRLK